MLTKNESDLIWKIRHGAIPIGRFLYGCKYSDSPKCNYCSELDDLTHNFVTCSILSGLFQLNKSLIRKLTPQLIAFLFGGVLFVSQLVLVLVLMLDAWANGFLRRKMQLYNYSIFNIYRSSGTHCVVTLFKAKLISRVNVEYQFASLQNTVCNLVEKWNAYNEKWK